jgi:hypothetical protein
VKFSGFDEAKRLALAEFGPTSVIVDHTSLSENELAEYKISGLTHKLVTPSIYEWNIQSSRLS